MKSTYTKSGLILALAMLFVCAINVKSQEKESINSEEQNIKLRSKIKEDNYSTLKNIKKVSNFNSEKEKFQNEYSSFKTFSESNREKIVQGILADPSDSAYIYDWNTEIEDWFLDTRILYYSSASSVEIIEEKKAEESDDWEKQNKSEYLYYNSNGLQRLTNSFWKDATKEWIVNEIEAYNEKGMETEYFFKVWNDTTQKFIDGIRIVSTYENDTNLVEDILQEWDTVTNSWSFALMVENEFNSKGLITSSIEKVYDKESSDWGNSYYMTYEYDETYYLTGETWQYWDTISSQWMNDVNISRTYNEVGAFSGQLVQVWDTVASEWENNNQRMIGYNDFLDLVSINDQIWDSSSESWEDTTRATYVYTDLGDYSSYLEEVWNGTSWENTYQETYTYDANNFLTDILLEKWKNDDWVYYAVIYYTYDAIGGYIKSRQDDYWNPNTESWETEFYAELAVVANALDFIEYYDKDWNDTLYKFTGGYRELYEYYYNGQTKELTVQEWDSENSQWVNDQKIEYYWYAALSTNPNEYDEISIYPTPFRNNLNIELNENINSAEIKLYNIQGQKIDTYFFDKKVNSIDLSRLKNGVYFIVYEANNRKFVKKIVKQ